MAAAVRHMVKLGTHKKALEEAGDQGLPFTKGPLAFETTGAMGFHRNGASQLSRWRQTNAYQGHPKAALDRGSKG